MGDRFILKLAYWSIGWKRVANENTENVNFDQNVDLKAVMEFYSMGWSSNLANASQRRYLKYKHCHRIKHLFVKQETP